MNYRNPQALEQIIELSRWAGDPSRDLAILAEGNTSIKVGDAMLVKASGASLMNAEASDFVEVERAPLEALVDDGKADDAGVAAALAAATTWGTRKPSVESLLHIVCQRNDGITAVVHTHPTVILAMLSSDRADALVAGSYFPDQIVTLGTHSMLLPYIDPGLNLAHRAAQEMADHVKRYGAPPKAIYLANHGLFALGADVGEAQRITQMAVKSARVVMGALSVGAPVPMPIAEVARINTRPDEVLRRALLSE